MTESLRSSESFEKLPTEEQVFEAMTVICAGKSFVETGRVVREGKLKGLEVRLDELNNEGLQVQLDYIVNKAGVATIDVTFYDPGKGFDYRAGAGYEPQDIVGGATLGKFVEGVWQQEGTL